MNNGVHLQNRLSNLPSEVITRADDGPEAAVSLPAAKPVDRRGEAYYAEAPARRCSMAERMASGYAPPNWVGYRRLGGGLPHAPIGFECCYGGNNRSLRHFRGYVVDGVPYVALSGTLAADIGLGTRGEHGGRIDPTAARRHFSGQLCVIRTPPRGTGKAKKYEFDEVLPLALLEADCDSRGVSSRILPAARTALCAADLVTPAAAQAATPEQQPASSDKPQAAAAGMPLPSLLARRAELRERMINIMAEQERCDADIAREFERLGGHIRSLAAVYSPTS
jgi:hypothetical protein